MVQRCVVTETHLEADNGEFREQGSKLTMVDSSHVPPKNNILSASYLSGTDRAKNENNKQRT
jgi:hypothetical protein